VLLKECEQATLQALQCTHGGSPKFYLLSTLCHCLQAHKAERSAHGLQKDLAAAREQLKAAKVCHSKASGMATDACQQSSVA